MTNSEFEPLLRAGSEDERRLLGSAKADASRPGAREAMLAGIGVPAIAPPQRWFEPFFRASGASYVNGIVLAILVGSLVAAAFTIQGTKTSTPASADRFLNPAAANPVSIDAPPAPREAHADTKRESDDSFANAPVVAIDALPTVAAKPVVKATSREPGDDLEREIARIEAARGALAHDDASQTLMLLDSYEREFSRGAFAIEVTVLRIEALARSGRNDEARRLADAFLATHREGTFAHRVNVTLSRMTPSAAHYSATQLR